MNKYLGVIVAILLILFIIFNYDSNEQKTQINKSVDTPNKEKMEECQEFIELHSPSYLAKEYGKSEQYIVANVKINLWKGKSAEGRWPAVGKLLPGSKAIIIEKSNDQFKVKSPYDNSVGWISKIQVSHTLFQNINTNEPCEK